LGSPVFVARDARGTFDVLDCNFGSSEADESPVEEIEPPAQHLPGIPRQGSGNKNHFHAIRNPREFLQRRADIGHVHRTLIGAERVSKEEQCDITVSLFGKIKWPARGLKTNR
jgi:hypothetical protein